MKFNTFTSFISLNMIKPSACFSKVILFFILGTVFISCGEDYFLSVSTDNIEISLAGEEVEFTVSSNLNWAITAGSSWATVSQTSGNGDAVVTLKVDGNASGADRNTTLSVSSGPMVEVITVAQRAIDFALSTNEMVFDVAGSPQTLTVTSNCSWTISIPDEAKWCEADVLSGDGDAVITFSPTPYTEHVLRDKRTITFTCSKVKAELIVSQEIDNEPPTSPTLLIPQNAASTVGFPVSFSWNPSTDPDGDRVYYNLYLSEDGQTWGESVVETTDTQVSLATEQLKALTAYYWKIVAKDMLGGKSESGVYYFTSGEHQFYSDGLVMEYQTFSAPDATAPVNLVILGDGFIDHDYMPGGKFDMAVEKTVDSFFSVEPFPTYQEYFTIYKVVAYSEERGATVKQDFYSGPVKRQTKNTIFSSVLEGGTSTAIACDDEAVFNYVLKVPGITEADLPNTTIIVIINLDVYAGTALMWASGKSIALCPTGNSFREIVYHEASGHAFGKLYDEYIYYSEDSYPSAAISKLESFRQNDVWSFAANLSLTDDRNQVHWKHYFEKNGYEMVGMHEGGDSYGKGIWRPEENSCMKDNTPYFNAPSREAIVRRIMSINGKGFSYDSFYAKDNTQYPVVSRGGFNKRPLGPPVLISSRR